MLLYFLRLKFSMPNLFWILNIVWMSSSLTTERSLRFYFLINSSALSMHIVNFSLSSDISPITKSVRNKGFLTVLRSSYPSSSYTYWTSKSDSLSLS
jgi:hypothetical protein